MKKYERLLQKNNKILFQFTILWLCIFFIFSFIACAFSISSGSGNRLVYAEETETQQNQIVNFNQVFLNTNLTNQTYAGITITRQEYQAILNGTATATDWLNLTLNLDNEHIYYYRNNFDLNSNYSGVRIEGTSTQAFYTNDFILNIANTTTYFGYYFYSGRTYNNLLIKPILIDLTLMYGENIPTLEECRQIFTSDYYNYTTGTTILLDGLDSYSRGYTAGFNSAWESQNVSYKQFVIGAQSFAFNNQQYTAESTKTFDAIAGAYAFSGVLGIPLGFTSVGGTNYEIDFTLLCTDWAQESLSFKQEFSLYFYYVDSDNNLIQVGKIPYYEINGDYGTYKGSFNCPVDTDTIYLEFTTEPLDNSSTVAVAFSSNITFRSQNIESAINSAFNAGVESVKETYLPGGDLYLEIYRNAYDKGVMDANTNNSVFQDGWHFIASAFGSVGEILSVELIPGVQIGVFVALPVLLGLIVLIIKILGKGS